MPWPDLSGKVALITGGTRGLGLATGLELGLRGVQLVLTHKWGSENEDAVASRFLAAGAPAPLILQADAGSDEDTDTVIDAIGARFTRLDIFICNACVASRGGSLADLKRRDLVQSLKYSTWPMLVYADAARRRFGAAPSTIIAMSSDGPDHHYPQYDYVATVKAALEALAANMARDLAGQSRVFVLRARQVTTQSFSEIFSTATQAMLNNAFANFAIAPEAVARAVVALCSGYLDGLNGGTLNIDRGATFADNILTAGPWLLNAGIHEHPLA